MLVYHLHLIVRVVFSLIHVKVFKCENINITLFHYILVFGGKGKTKIIS